MAKIDFSQPPHSQSDVEDAYENGECAGVEDHFRQNAIQVGDCTVDGGTAYRITGHEVVCDGDVVLSDGDTSGSPATTHEYVDPPDVQVRIYGDEIPLEDCP